MMEMAQDNIQHARMSLLQAQLMRDQEDWALCIARSSEAIEFSLKAAIRSVGGSYKRTHDISGDLLNPQNIALYPVWFRQLIARYALLSQVLSLLFPRARYGYEELDTPSSALFSRLEAVAYLYAAEEIFQRCQQLLSETEHL